MHSDTDQWVNKVSSTTQKQRVCINGSDCLFLSLRNEKNKHLEHFTLTCVVQMPGICCGRHWGDGERWRPAVGLHQFTLVRHRWRGCRLLVRLTGCWRGLRLCGCSERRLERGDSVELHPRQTANEARGVVALDEDRVYVSRFCTQTHGWREAVMNTHSQTLLTVQQMLGVSSADAQTTHSNTLQV